MIERSPERALPVFRPQAAPPAPPATGELLRDALARLSVRVVELSAAREVFSAAAPDQIPPDGQSFHESGAVDLPAAPSAETLVHSWTVPAGFDGLLTRVGHVFTGGSFTPSSGEIVWRYKIDGAYLRGMHALTVEFGDASLPNDLPGAGLRVFENQTIALTVEHVSNAGLNGRIVAQFAGYLWNRR